MTSSIFPVAAQSSCLPSIIKGSFDGFEHAEIGSRVGESRGLVWHTYASATGSLCGGIKYTFPVFT